MENTRNPKLTQDMTDTARDAVRKLLRDSTHAALAVIEPETGHPLCTRVGLATLRDGTPILLVSALAAHTPALLADPRCALLVGDVGRGDPLAHPRVMLTCAAEEVARDSTVFDEARERHLATHPKAKIYLELPDFRFFRLTVLRGRYNGGFGKAYLLKPEDVVALQTNR